MGRSGLVALAVLLGTSALAQAPSAPAYAFEAERLELNPSGLGSQVVGSGELLPASSFRSAVMAHYQHEPLLYVADGTRQGRLIRERLTLHLMRQYSLSQRVEFALVLPIVVFQSGDTVPAAGLSPLAAGGLASPLLSARLAIVRSADGAPFDLALQAGTSLPFGNAYAFARNPGLTFSPRLLASLRLFDTFLLSAEGGGLLRPPVTLGDYRIHNEANLHAALATLRGPLRGEVAVRGGYYFGNAPTSLEALAGARYAITDRIELHALAGAGLLRAPGTPMFRVLFGASFLEGTTVAKLDAPRPDAPGPVRCVAGKSHDPAACPDLDLDSDGLKNAADQCPAAAEDKDGHQDGDGCPDPDNDGDSVADDQDTCPAEAGPASRGGCPVPDQDKDGVADPDDKCPSEAGAQAQAGCPIADADKDGVPDEKDKCPNRHGPPDREGCPLSDADADGVLDAADGCPDQAGPLEARGCPVKDSDGDGVADHQDNCPAEKGTAANRGCKAKQQVFITREKIVILDKVYFATNSAKVLPRSFPLLNQVAEVIKSHPEIKKVVVEGHTDNTGNALRNLRLSRERADSVRRYLVDRGVPADRLESKGFGQGRPVMPNLTPRGRDANRRVEFVIPESAE